MVVINKFIADNPCNLYLGENLIGSIDNVLQFMDVRAQIGEQNLIGYEVDFNGIRIPIYADGRLPEWPEGFFDEWDKLMSRIMQCVIKKK